MSDFTDVIAQFLIEQNCQMPSCNYVACMHIDLMCDECAGYTERKVCRDHYDKILAAPSIGCKSIHQQTCSNGDDVSIFMVENLLDTI